MTINEYIKKTRITGSFVPRNPHITCKDGFTMSVQANNFTYCRPRVNDADGFYTHMEVGFPSAKPECFADYAEDDSDYTETVYGYVPVEFIDEEIAFHGGIKED